MVFLVFILLSLGTGIRRSYTLTNTCVVCPPVKCPLEDFNTTRRSAASRRASKRNEQRAFDKVMLWGFSKIILRRNKQMKA